MTKTTATLVCLLIMLLAPQAGLAQAQPQKDWKVLQSLRFGDKVEVTLKNKKSIRGEFGNATDMSLTIFKNKKAVDFMPGDVVKVSHMLPKHVGRTTFRGAAIGAGAGAVLGAIVGEDCSRPGGGFICFERSVTVPVGAALAAIPGAGAGLIVGLARRGRLTIYDVTNP